MFLSPPLDIRKRGRPRIRLRYEVDEDPTMFGLRNEEGSLRSPRFRDESMMLMMMMIL